MSALDWLVLLATISFIVLWGIVRYRGQQTAASYLKGENLSWFAIGLSVMATQASAVTFLSTPGQAYEDGLGFVQFYFGLPIAAILVAVVFVPLYYRLKVFTAYEYLEARFDVRVRLLAAGLFLVSRGLATGISIYAPAILFAIIFGWPLKLTAAIVGVLVILYTVIGGSRAVAQTQVQQMAIILLGLGAAAFVAYQQLPSDIGLHEALSLAGALDRLNPIDTTFDLSNRYNLWSGILGGLILQLAYFGTDQSQVARYLGGKDSRASKLGMLFNGVLKIPMQTAILFIGVLVFVLYLFHAPPIFWNTPTLEAARQAEPALIETIEGRWEQATQTRQVEAQAFLQAQEPGQREDHKQALRLAQQEMDALRVEAKAAIATAVPGAETEDRDFIFFSYAMSYLPAGLLGLLVAVIISATMSSISSAISSLGSTTVVDFHIRLSKTPPDDATMIRWGRIYTVLWGLLCIAFAVYATLLDNLIQAVNILGSLFYGTALGIFLTAFFLRSVQGTAVFWGAIIAEAIVIFAFFTMDISFLWLNPLGAISVIIAAFLIQQALPSRPQPQA